MSHLIRVIGSEMLNSKVIIIYHKKGVPVWSDQSPACTPPTQGDVVYEETLTEAMLKTAAALLRFATQTHIQSDRSHSGSIPGPAPPSCPPRMIIAMEKRYCFTLRDMDSRAPAFDHFLSLIDVQSDGGSEDGGEFFYPNDAGVPSYIPAASIKQPQLPDKILKGRRLCVDAIPKRLHGYDRGSDLELWELTLPG